MKPELLIGGIDVIKFRNLLFAGQRSLSVQTVQTVQMSGSFVLNYGNDVIHYYQVRVLKRIEAMGRPPVFGGTRPVGPINSYMLGLL